MGFLVENKGEFDLLHFLSAVEYGGDCEGTGWSKEVVTRNGDGEYVEGLVVHTMNEMSLRKIAVKPSNGGDVRLLMNTPEGVGHANQNGSLADLYPDFVEMGGWRVYTIEDSPANLMVRISDAQVSI